MLPVVAWMEENPAWKTEQRGEVGPVSQKPRVKAFLGCETLRYGHVNQKKQGCSVEVEGLLEVFKGNVPGLLSAGEAPFMTRGQQGGL